MTKSTITRELVHWLHDAATEFASTKLKMTMKPDEVLALTGALLASMDTEPVGWTDEAELRDVEKDGCGYLFKANPISPHADPRRVIKRHCCKVSDEAAFCLIQRPYISKTLLTRRISPRGSP
ncbi:hypothetical protein CJ307_25530 (plasmid) [Klebsiella quasipneumoniae]|nr:hypothetical protein CJ307_25530 [Klebsiella quasipneumoniae]